MIAGASGIVAVAGAWIVFASLTPTPPNLLPSLAHVPPLTLIATLFCPFGMAVPDGGLLAWPFGLLTWGLKMMALATALACFETGIAKMRVFRVPEFLGVAILFGLLAAVVLFVSTGFATGGN